MISFYRPGRSVRRRIAGARCVTCGLGITADDLAMGQFDQDQQPLHIQCVDLLINMLKKEDDAGSDAVDSTE